MYFPGSRSYFMKNSPLPATTSPLLCMAVIAAQYLQGYSFSGRLHADNMVRRVRKIVREIDSLEASKLRNKHSH
jgi:hypothetical protein